MPIVLLVLGVFIGCSSAVDSAAGPATQRVELGGETFELELAADSESRIRGLSDRPSIPEDGGMLFVFPDAKVRHFVMRRCLVPIDIVYLSPTGRIVAMHEMQVEPYDTPEGELRRYGSVWPAQFAIEVAGGTIDRLGLETGESVDLPIADLKRLAR